MGEIIDKVRDELLGQTNKGIEDYLTTGLKSAGAARLRSEWLYDHLGQLCIVITQWAWTTDTEVAFDNMQLGQRDAMKQYNEKQIEMMNDLIMLVQDRGLEKNHRRKAMNLITMETHSRDIVISMIEDNFDTKDCFKWMGQLKTRYEQRGDAKEKDIWADICDASFQYSFEYLGNPGRLVITPLTDRIYITATQASHLNLGCAPAGPAGTGKTESTKDLSAALGKAVYVFNCGPEMDYRTMADIFKGLGSSGSWGCFDEFNRLLPEVLSVCSVQYKAVLDGQGAKASHFIYDGVE
jgi:dynein heavy chain